MKINGTFLKKEAKIKKKSRHSGLLGFDLQLIDYATKYSLAKTAKLIYIACVIYVLWNFNQDELER